ncbi:MAG TPA: DNA-directed RNA polymerase subunit M [Clostridiales bacterium]|nr:DNA-directed RNA polymerase subunit M [Clostridiales bacterium]
MLNMYICPKCLNYRIVSRNPNPECFHCGGHLDKTELDYIKFSEMEEEERNLYKENYKRTLNIKNKIQI